MADLKVSQLADIGTPVENEDYILVLDVSASDLARALISQIKAPDDDFYNNVAEVSEVQDADYIMVYDVSAGAYRKAALSVFTADPPEAFYGYFWGGYSTGGSLAVTDKFGFVAETAEAKGNISIARRGCHAICYADGQIGYIGGGLTSGSALSVTKTVDKYNFGSDTSAASDAAALLKVRAHQSKGGDGSEKALWLGGWDGGFYLTEAESLDMQTDATALSAGAELTVARGGMASLTDLNDTEIFSFGGINSSPTYFANADKTDLTTETTGAAGGAFLTSARNKPVGVGNGDTKGFILAGTLSSGSESDIVDTMTFATELVAVSTGTVNTARRGSASATQGGTCGYISSGYDGSNYIADTEKITYTTEVVSAVATGDLTATREELAGNSTLAY
jgi:hypothetical protein